MLLRFIVSYKNRKFSFIVDENETVLGLKAEISRKIGIPTNQFKVHNWHRIPEDDFQKLLTCCRRVDDNCLTVTRSRRSEGNKPLDDDDGSLERPHDSRSFQEVAEGILRTSGAAVNAGVRAHSLGKRISRLTDRDKVLDKGLSLDDSDTRSLCLGIAADTVGLLGAAGNVAACTLAAQGQDASAAVNFANAMNVAESGIGVASAVNGVVTKFTDDDGTFSVDLVAELCSSILAFGNSIKNFMANFEEEEE